ncbi:probable inactive poly [ADP-ribose] polymerase SRO2 [Rhododendron vialii]|uniref:probable inactive poly [ADP-ribose] polymerase SRO2 n=1 Tax=Rhododendron vialii TaxID=182163 RepID=UPI0026605094|nr:probable inactive poly [ADP-ribose] polymerase SRO2 [Rhododendron vialii]
MEDMGLEDQVSIVIDDEEVLTSDSEFNSASSSFSRFGFFTRNGMALLEDGNSERRIIERSFLKGLGQFGKETKVVAIHKNSYSSPIGQARMESFRIFSEAVKRKSGGNNANVKYAWYGASRGEICEIVTHGFGRFRGGENSESCGLGVHLSPANFSIDGMISSGMDDNGIRHLLLCRVILGNTEVVHPGSKQIRPSSTKFDSGVDNLLSPRRYTIWSPYMNSHIFPNYVVSFRAPRVTGFERIRRSIVGPSSPYMTFPTLLSTLSRFLPLSKMVLITKFYSAYRENKLSRIQLIQKMRRLAGDKLLIAVIKFDRKKQLQARIRSSASADLNGAKRYAAGA